MRLSPRRQTVSPSSHKFQALHKWSTPLTGGEVLGPVNEAALSHWWTVFNDPILTSLEERALKSNLDLRAALSKTERARANRQSAGGSLVPGVTFTGSASRAWASTQNGVDVTHGNTAEFDVSWESDFSRIARDRGCLRRRYTNSTREPSGHDGHAYGRGGARLRQPPLVSGVDSGSSQHPRPRDLIRSRLCGMSSYQACGKRKSRHRMSFGAYLLMLCPEFMTVSGGFK